MVDYPVLLFSVGAWLLLHTPINYFSHEFRLWIYAILVCLLETHPYDTGSEKKDQRIKWSLYLIATLLTFFTPWIATCILVSLCLFAKSLNDTRSLFVSLRFVAAFGWHLSLLLIVTTFSGVSVYAYWSLVAVFCVGFVPLKMHLDWLLTQPYHSDPAVTHWIHIRLHCNAFFLFLHAPSAFVFQSSVLLWALVTAKTHWLWESSAAVCLVFSVHNRWSFPVTATHLAVIFVSEFVHLFYNPAAIKPVPLTTTVKILLTSLVLVSAFLL